MRRSLATLFLSLLFFLGMTRTVWAQLPGGGAGGAAGDGGAAAAGDGGAGDGGAGDGGAGDGGAGDGGAGTDTTPNDSDRATARDLFFAGYDAFEAGKWREAAELLDRSNQLYPAPTALLWQARALVKLRKLVEGHERYRQILAKPLPEDASPGFVTAYQEAGAEVAALAPRIPSLRITTSPGAATRVTVGTLVLKGASLGVAQRVNPGSFNIRATAPGYLPLKARVTLKEGEHQRLDLKLTIDPSAAVVPKPKPLKTKPTKPITPDAPTVESGSRGLQLAGFALIGVGAASLVGAAVTGGLYFGEVSTADRECDAASRCSEIGLAAVERGRTYALVNTATLVSGLAITGTGALLAILGGPRGTPAKEQKTSMMMTPIVAPGLVGASIGGTF